MRNIGKQAFKGCSNLEVISFGARLNQIGLSAFSGCSSLKHIHIPGLSQWLDLSINYVYELYPGRWYEYYYDTFPFYDSGEGHLYVDGEELTFIDIPSGYKILRYFAFLNCKSITGVAFPSGFTSTGRYSNEAFARCVNLKTIAAPSLQDWMSIHWYPTQHPFYSSGGGRLIIGGEEVTHLVIPDGIEEIPAAAFLGCSHIQEVTLPQSLRIIQNCAFYMCDRLERANIASVDAWLNLDMTAVFSYGGISTYSSSPFAYSGEGHLFIDGVEVTTINVPSGCVEIPRYAFSNCLGITDVILPAGMKTIGQYAFDGCTGITDVTLPEGIKTIDKYAFKGCTSLKRVYIPSLQTWLDLSFSNGGLFSSSHEGHILLPFGEEVREVVIPEQTKSIGDYAFEYCVGLESITLEPPVPPTLGTNVFRGVTCPIYVWAPCLDAYKKASGWTSYANLLTANPDTP